ncbi:MAG TPA: 4-(cytidine 5'-diphospho)-2-C-methyl-D-erythritol kinase [Azospirillum sp.]|nr:4-(cytidine 5'-diphospho)-2-C-methyl-D-erythritol kinase [Azospirillum sp.]
MTDTTAIVEAAPAKLNLYLHVLGRRADGYHELDSLIAFAGVGDRLTVTPAAGGPHLEITGPFSAPLRAEDPAGNLVTRAALALAERLGRPPAVRIALEKNLPVASGIGGGSADAAACLRALARLWDMPADHPDLYAVGLRLGADVPVCIKGRPAYFGGIGDRLDLAPALPDTHVVLVNPGVPVPTPAVFKARQGGFSPAARFDHAPADAAELAALLRQRRNDLTEAALTVAPVIAEVLAAIDATPGCLLARLSGSGATGFGLYATATEAEIAAAHLTAEHPGWWVRAAELLG